jgi:hypothetical protein
MKGDPAAFDAPFFSITAQGKKKTGRFRLSIYPNTDM